jgi:hypothetical protein
MTIKTIHQLCFHLHVGVQCITINCNVYVHWHGPSFIIIVLYVDDAILVTLSFLQHIKIELQLAFVMINHGVIHHLLGMWILHNCQANTLFLTQAHYM